MAAQEQPQEEKSGEQGKTQRDMEAVTDFFEDRQLDLSRLDQVRRVAVSACRR